MTSKHQQLKKAKQAARREARQMANEYMESLTDSYFSARLLKTKPRYMPKWIRDKLTAITTKLPPADVVRIKLTPKQIYHILKGDEVATNGSRIITGDYGKWVIKSIFNQVMREYGE